ncbi:MAG: hypothetical protein FWD21_01515 [Peptococcaceae bacterium]|nr:hypothetical protein [Peptococcaceae bacterium]
MIANKPVLQAIFKREHCRHVSGSHTLVLHCNHIVSLISKLANECSHLNGKKLLSESSEDVFYSVLADYYLENSICSIDKRIEIAERYFSEAGLGKLTVKYAGLSAGEVELKFSLVDESWLNKWGQATTPINYIGCGYVTALFSALFDKPRRSYAAKEQQSIACGADVSIITITDAFYMERRIDCDGY